MAKPRMVETGTGHVTRPGRVTKDVEGKISDATIYALKDFADTVEASLNGGLRLGPADNLARAGNFKAQHLEFTTPSGANTEISVPHSLGEAPSGYIVTLQNKAGALYTSNFGGWDTQTVYFKCDVASVLFNIIVFL